MKELLGTTKDGARVYLDSEKSHAITHFAHHPKLRAVVEQIIPTLESGPEIVRIEHDAGEIIGTTDLVETNENDEIVYAMRPRRTVYSRFAKGKTPAPTSWITFALHRTGKSEYTIYTAFIGRNTPSFPGGDYLPEQSREFWSKHALVWGSQEVVPGTETLECPW